MTRIFLIIFGAGVTALAAGFVYLGAAPPAPPVHDIHVVLSNDRFGDQNAPR